MTIEVKSCPFCGAAAETDYCRGYRALGDGRLGNAAAIYCTECHADMTICYRDVPDLDHDEAMISLAEAWNKRTPTHEPSEALETLKKWLASYVWEAGAFGKYRDDVALDGVMTAGKAYALAKLFDVQAEAPRANRRFVSTNEQTPVQGAEPLTSLAHPEREAVGRTGSSNLPTGATSSLVAKKTCPMGLIASELKNQAEGMKLIAEIEAAEHAARKSGFHVTAAALNRAKNSLGWEIAGDTSQAHRAAFDERPKR